MIPPRLASLMSEGDPTIRVRAGSRTDYAPFASMHYRAGPPATIDRVLVASVGREPVGVLVTSRPVLNAAWRDAAWPGRFSGPDKTRNARRINRELRTISRVVVDPRARGLGVATALVRRYLADPATRCTEAVAAMGRHAPFFASGGMTRVESPEPASLARLREDIARLGLTPLDLLRAPRRSRCAVDRWALSGRRLSTYGRASFADRARGAAAALACPIAAFAHTVCKLAPPARSDSHGSDSHRGVHDDGTQRRGRSR